MPKAILFTQCLQNDFIEPIGKHEPLPNLLHIGYEESKRLMGEFPDEGPINTLMKWAYQTCDEDLLLINIRDWHDEKDLLQKNHLNQFGNHCIQNSKGSDFVFSKFISPHKKEFIINASGLNDFIDTDLDKILEPYKHSTINVGIVGVWTEAKVTFLNYELKTRYPNFVIAICSALTASSSTSNHYISLQRLKDILGSTILESVGDFTHFLTGSVLNWDIPIHSRLANKAIKIEDGFDVKDEDLELIRFLFRDSHVVKLKVLDGGFSGNLVLKSASNDTFGHKQAPSVVKIGNRTPIASEKASFERIKEVLGNNAPSIIDYVEGKSRAGIKYRYAAMFDEKVTSFQKFFEENGDLEKIKTYLDIVFRKQLGRLYDARKYEKLDLLKYYDFSNKYANSVRNKVESIIGYKTEGDTLSIEGISCFNVCNFYEKGPDFYHEYLVSSHFMAYVHGDLNGANIIIDSHQNVWIIDFFHTHYGHILKDLIKLENDLLFIFMKINSKEEWLEAKLVADFILGVHDLAAELPESVPGVTNQKIKRTYHTLRHLRSFYSDLLEFDRTPIQYFIAMMRYAMHTLSFDESSLWQKKLALYVGAECAERIINHQKESKKLRIDFLKLPNNQESKLKNIGITILPGRKDKERVLTEDITEIHNHGIKNIVCLLTDNEFEEYGVPFLKETYTKFGFNVYYFPIKDQARGDAIGTQNTINWINDKIRKGEKLLIHCVGGIGRSGMLAAYLLIKNGYKPEEAIKIVRNSRSPRAIETKEQEEFIKYFN